METVSVISSFWTSVVSTASVTTNSVSKCACAIIYNEIKRKITKYDAVNKHEQRKLTTKQKKADKFPSTSINTYNAA